VGVGLASDILDWYGCIHAKSWGSKVTCMLIHFNRCIAIALTAKRRVLTAWKLTKAQLEHMCSGAIY